LDDLDGPDPLQSSWKSGKGLVVKLGTGALRREVESALLEITVGTDRRLLVPRGTWADIDRELAISLVVVAIIKSADEESATSATFADIASAVPITQTIAKDNATGDLIDALTDVNDRYPDKAIDAVCRIKLRKTLFERLHNLMSAENSPTLRYEIKHIGTGHDRTHEIELSLVDLRTIIRFLAGGQ
jgi:hypothetical protein